MRIWNCIKAMGVAAMVVGILVSCVKDNGDVVDYDVVLAFNPAIYSPVKTSMGGSYPEGVAFGVTACSLPYGCCWADNKGKGDGFLNNEKVEFKDGRWLPQSNCNWPHVTRSLTCIAYSPYGAAEGCSLEGGVVFKDVNTVESQDPLLYTDPVTDLHKGLYGGVVSLPFKHALGSISINLKNLVDLSDTIKVTSVRLVDVKYKGSFCSLPAPDWTLEESKTELVFYEGVYASTQSPTRIGKEYLVIPQILESCFEVDFSYHTSAGTYINQTLRTRKVGTLIEPGRDYIYTLSVGIDEVKFMLEVIDSYLQ